jgi:23S rRNA (uracil1939-C5)-methyltransferase
MARRKKVYKDIQLSGIADKGLAVGRDAEGMVYFVDGAVPGDNVDVLVLRKKSSFRKGIVSQFNSLSDERVQAKCQHFGVCGGCKWQNLDYPAQLKYKEQAVKDAFKRLAKMDAEEYRPILGCERIFRYRNKMEYSFSYRRWVTKEEIDTGEDIDFGQAVGFHRAGSFDKVVQIEQCHLQDELSNTIRNHIHKLALEKNWSYYNSRDHVGFLRNLRVRNSTLGQWMLVVIFGEDRPDEIEFLLDNIKQNFPQVTSLHYVINQKKNDSIFDQDAHHYHGTQHLTERLGHLEYKIGPKSFFQTNSYQAEKLYGLVKEFANLKGDEIVYDLYTGLGSIALYLAQDCKKIIGIEEVPEAVNDARENKALNKIENAFFEVGDVKNEFNNKFVDKYGKADLIVVDPPRAGLHADVTKMLNQSDARTIIYVSCNPSTQARDIQLMDNYDIKILQPVDMFPHTHHIENIALLEKN